MNSKVTLSNKTTTSSIVKNAVNGKSSRNHFIKSATRHARAIALSLIALIIVVSVALAGDGVLPAQPQNPLRGNYCITAAGASLDDVFQTETITVDIDGTPVAAYLYWSGRYAESTNGDSNLTVSLNGGSPVFVEAEDLNTGTASYSDRFYYTYRSADLTQAGGPIVINQSTPFTMNIGGLRGDEGHGAGIVVVYENATSCSYGDVHLYYGLDSLHHRHSGVSGPNSEVNCIEFEASSSVRNIDYQMFVGGVATPNRPNAIWTKTGTGPLPSDYWQVDIIDDPAAIEMSNPLDGDEGNGEGEWDNHQSQFSVPAGHTYACVQIESVPEFAPDVLGASAVWVNLAAKVELEQPATPTNTPVPPTATPTNTNTPVPPTATPTNTNTPVPPTATPTNTNTPIPPTATPTNTNTLVPPTATSTNTPTPIPVESTGGSPTPVTVVPEEPTVTPTATPTATATPELPPVCTAQTDLHLAQAVGQTSGDNKVTITLSYWNSGSNDIPDVRITDLIPDFTSLDASMDNSAWVCENGSCTFEAGTLPANATQNEARQIQLHLVAQQSEVAGQSTVNRGIISQETVGLGGVSGCFVDGQALVELPTSLETIQEPNSPNVVPAIFMPLVSQ